MEDAMLFALLIALLVAAAAALVLSRTLHGTGRLSRPVEALAESTRWIQPGLLLAAAGVVLLLAAAGPHDAPYVLMAVVAAAAVFYARAWVGEFQLLMSLSDDDFPGRYDKPLWALALILLGPIGLWAFRRHRAVCWKVAAADDEVAGTAAPADRTVVGVGSGPRQV